MPDFDSIAPFLDTHILRVDFTVKPLIVGGLAMEYYGLRKHGSDVDIMVSYEDYDVLARRFPDSRKDSWGDLGVLVHGFEMFRTIWRLDRALFAQGAREYDRFLVVSLERLLFMKVLAMDVDPKHRADVDLIVKHIREENQRADALDYMNEHIQSYLAAPDGFVYGGTYLDDRKP